MKKKLPSWLRKPIQNTPERRKTESILKSLKLNTVCESAMCPNRSECYCSLTATVMILGKNCTRNCRFCAVASSHPEPLEPDEPERVAEMALRMGLKYIVVTSVTRDDIPDGGAGHFAKTVKSLKQLLNPPVVEILTPDFRGNRESFRIIAESKPDVWGHNVEVVPRLYSQLRPGADFNRSLDLLVWIKNEHPDIITKSGFMIGVGETYQEIIGLFQELRNSKVDIVVIGQYLAPSKNHWQVEKYYTPDEFEKLEEDCQEFGFAGILSKPFARSSYKAEELHGKVKSKKVKVKKE